MHYRFWYSGPVFFYFIYIYIFFIYSAFWDPDWIHWICSFLFYLYIYIYIIYIVHSGIPECTVDFDTLDLFFGRPDNDSIQSKHVAIRIFCVTNCCVSLKCIPCVSLLETIHVVLRIITIKNSTRGRMEAKRIISTHSLSWQCVENRKLHSVCFRFNSW